MTPASPLPAAVLWQGLLGYARAHGAVSRYHAGGKADQVTGLEAPSVALAELAASTPALALGLATLRPDDDDLAHHAVRAGLLAAALGQAVGLGTGTLEDVLRVALVHEAGTACLPVDLVHRAGALDAGERRAMARAKVLAIARLLRADPFDRTARVRIAALDGLRATAARVRRDERGEVEAFGEVPRPPVVSRLLAIGCAYDSLTMARPYRDAFTPREAITVMWTELAGRFDPALLGVFHHLLGVGPVRVHTERPRGLPVVKAAPEDAEPPADVPLASMSIAGSATLEFALDGEAAVELADVAFGPVVVELANDGGDGPAAPAPEPPADDDWVVVDDD